MLEEIITIIFTVLYYIDVCFRHYAKFLKCCKKWGLAIKALVRSMNELASLPAELDPMHISFNIPYSYLKTCYDLYKENK